MMTTMIAPMGLFIRKVSVHGYALIEVSVIFDQRYAEKPDALRQVRGSIVVITGGNKSISGQTPATIYFNTTATTTWSGSGIITVSDHATINNSGTWEVQSDASLTAGCCSPAFNNTGTFRKVGGTGTTTVAVPFNNSGAVEVQNGTLSFGSGASRRTGRP